MLRLVSIFGEEDLEMINEMQSHICIIKTACAAGPLSASSLGCCRDARKTLGACCPGGVLGLSQEVLRKPIGQLQGNSQGSP